ncbi:hypothetical protein TESG_06200 [Trichophyton tonsurans CBS 112818]|uniref:Uncharacterized protein n=1 Tax=Trichophyton tonsurans (strain CBS 112818) TaxID=647933 RepID=F2S5I7_TRIT1|nr:hypothetical protein TESG_06200 [Trichophyton tonsurans CBS 112818]
MSNPQPIRMPARSSTTAGFFKTASHRYGASMSISISSGLVVSFRVKRVSASTPGRGRSSSVAGWDQAIERVQSRGLDLKEDREDGWLGINVPVRAPGTPKVAYYYCVSHIFLPYTPSPLSYAIRPDDKISPAIIVSSSSWFLAARIQLVMAHQP